MQNWLFIYDGHATVGLKPLSEANHFRSCMPYPTPYFDKNKVQSDEQSYGLGTIRHITNSIVTRHMH